MLTDPSRNSEGEDRAEAILEDRVGGASQRDRVGATNIRKTQPSPVFSVPAGDTEHHSTGKGALTSSNKHLSLTLRLLKARPLTHHLL